METKTIILIITNIAVPIVVAIITAIAQSKKYKKEIALLNVQHENKIKEIVKDYEHQIEILKLQFQQQKELENQLFDKPFAHFRDCLSPLMKMKDGEWNAEYAIKYLTELREKGYVDNQEYNLW